jgi:hypothetical protein
VDLAEAKALAYYTLKSYIVQAPLKESFTSCHLGLSLTFFLSLQLFIILGLQAAKIKVI